MAFDIYQVITNNIINQLEKGVVPWRKPWFIENQFRKYVDYSRCAYSRSTMKPYSFLNQMLLGKAGEWATFKQISEAGGKVNKGEKASMVVYWNITEKEVKDSDGNIAVETYSILKYYNVFHVETQTNLEPRKLPVQDADCVEDSEIEGIEILDDFAKKILSSVGCWDFHTTHEDRAYFSPMTDTVCIPEIRHFSEPTEYYSTMFHEFTHATGAKHRLDRKFGTKSDKENYAKEELVAELGSAFVLNLFDVQTKETQDNSVAYIGNWLTALKNDKKLIVYASSKAEKAVKYMTEMAIA